VSAAGDERRERDETVAVYEQRAVEWTAQRRPVHLAAAQEFAQRVAAARDDNVTDDVTRARAPVLDLGSGPGWYTAHLGRPAVALDAARAMLDLTAEAAPGAALVQADLAALPFRRASAAGAWASRSYVHLARAALPLALADLQRVLRVGAPLHLHVFAGDLDHDGLPGDDFAGRRFSAWAPGRLADVVTGAGFTIDHVDAGEPTGDGLAPLVVAATRAPTLADTVGPGMRLLVCGLNPSVYSADAGLPFARAGNRYWRAALDAGIVSRDRDPRHALVVDGVGMTDLVKRATPRADALAVAEYRAGVERVARLAEWLQPRAICFVGLAGWRAAVDRTAVAGEQPIRLGDSSVYVMPSTSGLNARTPPAELAAHLRAAATLADRPRSNR